MYYFAYGSNMSEQQMKERCGKENYELTAIGVLKGYRFVYDGNSSTRKGAVGNIVKDENSQVWGVIYKINKDALTELDKYEGYKVGSYDRKILKIMGNDKNTYDAYTYYRTGKKIGAPSNEYRQTVKMGAEEHGLPEDYIKKFILV